MVAIKFLNDVFKDSQTSKNVLREICILKHFTNQKDCVFVPKLYDIVIAGNIKNFNSIFLVMEYGGYDLSKLIGNLPM